MANYKRSAAESRECRGCGNLFAPGKYNRTYCDVCRAVCRVDGCSDPVRARGYCAAHGRKTHPVIAVAIRPMGLCGIDGCERHAFSKGHCQFHYDRVRFFGSPGEADPKTRKARGGPCAVDGCDRPAAGDGLCVRHYARRRKTGVVGEAGLQRAAQGAGSITETGYRKIVVNGVYVFQHRHVMEQMLGRGLLAGENVHHRNGDRQDNRPENLEVWISQQPSGQRVVDLVEYALQILKRYPDELSDEGYRLLALESRDATQVLGAPSYEEFDPREVLSRIRGE